MHILLEIWKVFHTFVTVLLTSRNGAAVARLAHNQEAAGANPASATKVFKTGAQNSDRIRHINAGGTACIELTDLLVLRL